MAVACTGNYPPHWPGKVWDRPVHCWSVGISSQSTRDTLQETLLGPVGAWGTGMIPKELILKTTAKAGVANAVDTIEVKWLENGEWKGGISTIGFKSNEQGPGSFFGTEEDIIHIDEPGDELVYNECLLRTLTTGGIILHTITPKKGLTRMLADYLADCEMVGGSERLQNIELARALMLQEVSGTEDEEDFSKKISKVSRAAVTIAWADAPWLDEDEKDKIRAATPLHLRNTVEYGLPVLGTGSVYPIPLEEVVVDSFAIPKHFKKMYGMDVGWNKTAVPFIALDPDNDIVYVYGEHYAGHQAPELHAAAIKRVAGDWMVGAIDPASKYRSQMDGKQLMGEYRKLGLRLREADNQVDVGIHRVWSRLATGKLKFFKETTPHLQNEYLLYRRDQHGKIIKKDDHMMDSLRYAISSLHFANYAPSELTGLISPAASGGNRYNV